jgi:putative FmdB family regulatory protein
MMAVPTYAYQCKRCGYEFERFQSITAGAVRKCPKCGRNGLRRLIGTGAGIIFKGSGFYATDYRSESYKKAEQGEKGAPDKKTGDKKTEAGSADSKTAEKSKAKDTEKSD